MKKLLLVGFAAALLYAPLPSNAAQKWGLIGEKVVRFDARVVDLLCELTGDCPENCGGGKRQLGLIDASGKLFPVFKNVVPFAGAAAELLDFCGKTVTADGLMSTNRGATIFSLQFVREDQKNEDFLCRSIGQRNEIGKHQNVPSAESNRSIT